MGYGGLVYGVAALAGAVMLVAGLVRRDAGLAVFGVGWISVGLVKARASRSGRRAPGTVDTDR